MTDYDLSTEARGCLEAAIAAEMKLLGYGKDFDGTFVNSNGIHVQPPRYGGYAGDSGDTGELVLGHDGVSINVYESIYLPWKLRVEAFFAPWFDLVDPAGLDQVAQDILQGIKQLATQGRTDVKKSGAPHLAYEANTTIGLAGDVASTIAPWQGDAAVAFKTYLSLFDDVVGNQAMAADAIRACIYMEKEVWTRANKDIVTIARQAQDAFGEVGVSGADVAALLSVVESVSTVLSWFPGFSAVTDVVDKGTAAAGVAGVFVDTFGPGSAEKAKNPLGGGGSPDDVWSRVVSAAADLRLKLRQVEGDVDNSLRRIHAELIAPARRANGSKDQAAFVLERPTGILEADERSDVISDKAVLVVESSTIRSAGRSLIKDLAPEMHYAARKLRPADDASVWMRDPSFGIGPTGPRSSYRAAVDFLATEVGQTGDELEWAGETLASIASTFDRGDDAVAEGLGRVHTRMKDDLGSR